MILKKKIWWSKILRFSNLVFLICLLSCARQVIPNNKFVGVELKNDPSIIGPSENNDKNESLSQPDSINGDISGGEHEEFGPILGTTINEEANIVLQNKTPEPIVGLIIGPGLYRSLGAIGLIKAFAKRNVKISVTSGQEFGALVSAYYSRDGSVSNLEWLLFKLSRSGDLDLEPYSEKWKSKMLNKLIDGLKNLDFEDLKTPDFVTLYNKKTNLLEHFAKGQMYGPLERLFDVNNEGIQGASMTKQVYSINFMKKLGADIIIAVDVLGSKIKMKKNSPLIDTYTQVSKKIDEEKKYIPNFFTMNLDTIDLDSSRLDDVIKLCESQGLEIAEKVRSLINTWKENYKEAH